MLDTQKKMLKIREHAEQTRKNNWHLEGEKNIRYNQTFKDSVLLICHTD